MMEDELTPDEIARRVERLGPWFQNIDLKGVLTSPEHFLGDYPMYKWKRFAHAVPGDLSGRSVLDIGCNAGFYSIEMKRRGASRVLAIDIDDDYLAQASFAASVLGADIEFRNMSVYGLSGLDERFDLVLFLGVFYHLRHPLLALDLVYEHAAADLLVFQSMLRGGRSVEGIDDDYPFNETQVFERPSFPRMHFIEKNYSGDPTNWWLPNRACAEAMLRSSGFEVIDNPESEVFICRRGERRWALP